MEVDPEEDGECGWELELIKLSSLLDLLRLTAASNSVTVLLEFESKSLGKRVLGTFANNYGSTKPDIFSYTLYDGEDDGSFLIYRADETGESFSFSKNLPSTESMVFPLVRVSDEPRWFSERLFKEKK